MPMVSHVCGVIMLRCFGSVEYFKYNKTSLMYLIDIHDLVILHNPQTIAHNRFNILCPHAIDNVGNAANEGKGRSYTRNKLGIDIFHEKTHVARIEQTKPAKKSIFTDQYGIFHHAPTLICA
jgi:hypothetical protein